MHNFTLPTGQKPHTHNTQSGATSVMPTGQRSGLSAANALHKPNPPSTNPSKSCTRTLSLHPIFLPQCTYRLCPCPQDLVWDSFHFFPDSAPFTLITSCSWQIPLSNLPTTALLSPFRISTYHTPSTASSPLFICCHAAPFPPHIIQTPRSSSGSYQAALPSLIYKPSCLCSLRCPNYLLSLTVSPGFP